MRGVRICQAVKRGFTLVELLVVVGIIAVLISILLPAMSKARDQANTVTCLSNLKQVMTGVQGYAADNNGFVVPAQWLQTTDNPLDYNKSLDGNEYWCTILVNGGYAQAPDGSQNWGATELGPQRKSAFYCPAGIDDLFSKSFFDNTGSPATRQDAAGATGVRCYSFSTKTSVDCWYGINADQLGSELNHGTPAQRVGLQQTYLAKISQIHQASNMVMLFDGVYLDIDNVDGNRVNARHARQTKTNLAFFDGHAATFDTSGLPGGLGNCPPSVFSYDNLSKNYPAPSPLWLLDQLKDY